MIAVDTNVIVRFLIRDEPLQFRQSFKLIESEAIFIPDTVILETVWVLDFCLQSRTIGYFIGTEGFVRSAERPLEGSCHDSSGHWIGLSKGWTLQMHAT